MALDSRVAGAASVGAPSWRRSWSGVHAAWATASGVRVRVVVCGREHGIALKNVVSFGTTISRRVHWFLFTQNEVKDMAAGLTRLRMRAEERGGEGEGKEEQASSESEGRRGGRKETDS